MPHILRRPPSRCQQIAFSLMILALTGLPDAQRVWANPLPLQGGITIVGTVTLPDGQPAPYFKVKITGISGLNFDTLTTDQGRYQLSNIPSGRYRITAYDPADT